MRRVAALVVGAAVLASGCGGKAARSAAEIAPVDARAFLSVPSQREQPLSRRALALVPDGQRFQRLLDRGGWARAAGQRVELAELADGRLVAYARLKDTKRLDAAHLAHGRVRGWTVFAPTKASLVAARSKQHLADAPWYMPAAEAAGRTGATLVARGWVAIAVDGGTVRRTEPGRGLDATHALARDIPADAVAAAASHDAARLLRTLPFAAELQRLVGLRPGDLARAAPGSAALYVRAGFPIPSVTFLAQEGSLRAARRLVHELAPSAPAPLRESVNGLSLEHVDLGALALVYGRVDRTLVVSDDPRVSFSGKALEPDGLPDTTTSWLYVDAAKARSMLGLLHAFQSESATTKRADRVLAGLASLLVYTTHKRGVATLTVVLR
jgi:hypothetical protein